MMSARSREDELSAENVYGKEAVTLYETLSQPLRHPSFWNTRGVEGVHRFFKELQTVTSDSLHRKPATKAQLHSFHCLLADYFLAVENVGEDGRHKEAIYGLMRLTRLLLGWQQRPICLALDLLRLANGWVPDLANNLWTSLVFNFPDAVHGDLATLPMVDREALISPEVEMTVLVNGLRRHTFKIEPKSTVAEILDQAMTPSVQANIGCRMIRQIVILPRRLVNFLTE